MPDSRSTDVAVLGSGSWGTALSILLARNGANVALWGRNRDEIGNITRDRENARYLPGFEIPHNVVCLGPGDEIPSAPMWVVATPASSAREVCQYVHGEDPLVVVASKGLESSEGTLLTEEICHDLGRGAVGVLSGPNLAVEIARGIPTAAVVAFSDVAAAERARAPFQSRNYRVYTSTDVIGVELAGALKNVLAIGAGMSDGLGFGDNTKGALLARGLNEMARLGVAMGARLDTFLGIAGVGDLFATAASRLSRNYRVGFSLGEGGDLTGALATIGQVAEGVRTAACVGPLARRVGVDLPLFAAIQAVLTGQGRPRDTVTLLMERLPKAEGIVPGEANGHPGT
ncbi:MAG: NAD(P)H-dependent glycerol-3-phosphate dehydrogenase [Fimbriimonadaceae bacterium]